MRLILVLLCATLGCAADIRLVAGFTTAKAGDLLTWRVENAPAAWLVGDVSKTPRLIITGPDARAWTRRCYLDQAWKVGPAGGAEFVADGPVHLSVRHTARDSGVHRWALWDPTGKAVATGEVRVGEATGPTGPLEVSKDNLRLLAFHDRTPLPLIGPNLAWASAPDRAGDFARYCAILKANGCNHVRVWFASWSGKVMGDTPDAWRLDHAWLMDRQLAAARANGIRTTLVLENFHDILTGKGAPYGATPEARVKAFVDDGLHPAWLRSLSYCLARWGADDTILAWEPINEIDMLQPIRERALPWAQAALAWLKKEDADHRLLTLSWAGEDWVRAMAFPELDLAQVRGYVFEWTEADWRLQERTRDALAMFAEPFEQAVRLGKPWILAEVGYQGPEKGNRGNGLDTSGLLLRQTLWSGFLLGGCGGGMNWWWDVYIDKSNLWGAYQGFAACTARIDWKDRELTPLMPNRGGPMRLLGWIGSRQALLWPSHISDTWYAHVGQGKPRPKPIQPVTAGLTGFVKSSTYKVTPLAMASGVAGTAWEQRSDPKGRLDLVIPPGTIDTVYVVELVKPSP